MTKIIITRVRLLKPPVKGGPHECGLAFSWSGPMKRHETKVRRKPCNFLGGKKAYHIVPIKRNCLAAGWRNIFCELFQPEKFEGRWSNLTSIFFRWVGSTCLKCSTWSLERFHSQFGSAGLFKLGGQKKLKSACVLPCLWNWSRQVLLKILESPKKPFEEKEKKKKKKIWVFPKIVGFPPKSSILTGFSIINHPFWGTPIFGNTYMLSKNFGYW